MTPLSVSQFTVSTDTNIYQIECAKNRYGPLFSGFLDWDIDRGRYEEKFELD